MAEKETPLEEKPKEGGPTPQFDYEQMRTAWKKDMAETIQQHMSTEDKDKEEPGYTPPTATPNVFQQVVDPIIQPHIRRLEQKAAAAEDAAIFYASTPEAGKHREEIEKAFNQMLQQGTPVARAGIWDWYWGKNRQKFIDAAIKEHDEELKKAKEAEDSSLGHGPTGKAGVKDAHDMTEEELGKALESVTF